MAAETHTDFEIAIERELHGALPAPEVAQLAEHLLGCETCRAYQKSVIEMETNMTAMSTTLSRSFMNEALAERVRAGVRNRKLDGIWMVGVYPIAVISGYLLVRALSTPLGKLCVHVTGNAADAEDALQDTLIAACRALPPFRGEAKLSTWVYRIALRTALEVKSRRTRRAETNEDALRGHVSDGVPADEQADVRQRAARLMAAMDQLNAEQRAVLSLFAVDGLKHDEIAAVLGVPEGTVWSRLHLARKKLAAVMANG